MIRICLAILFCVFAASAAVAQEPPCQPGRHAKVPVITDLVYAKARKKLIAAGWQPAQTKSINDAADDPDLTSGNGPIFWRRGYVELESCAGTGAAACSFLFKDAFGNRLRVITTGEEIARQSSAKVSRFMFVCD
jgi:hypothetical protein